MVVEAEIGIGTEQNQDRKIRSTDRPGGKSAGLNAIRWFSLGAIAGPILFDLAWIILGFLRRDYSSVSQTVSRLGVGLYGAFMNAAFILTGLLLIAGVIAVFQGFKRETGIIESRICTVIFLILPLGMIWSGIFTLNTPFHTAGAAVAIMVPMISFPIVGFVLFRIPGWRRFGTGLILSGPLTFFLLLGFTGSVFPSEMVINRGISGLWQRAVMIEILAWYMALGWRGFRRLR